MGEVGAGASMVVEVILMGSKLGAEAVCLGSGMSLFFFLSRLRSFFLDSFSSLSLSLSSLLKSEERGRFFCRLVDFLLEDDSAGPR